MEEIEWITIANDKVSASQTGGYTLYNITQYAEIPGGKLIRVLVNNSKGISVSTTFIPDTHNSKRN